MRVRFIKGFQRFYKVSTTGKVWSCRVVGMYSNKRGPWKRVATKPCKTGSSKGYHVVNMTLNGKGVRKAGIHQLVLETFIGPCPEGMECRHLDGNRGNNNLWNLCWGFPKENGADKTRHGTVAKQTGESNGRAKLNKYAVATIREWFQKGKYDQKQIARMFGITQGTVSKIVLFQIWTE